MSRAKIQPSDTLEEAMVKLARGNTGALTVLEHLIIKALDIDPDTPAGKFAPLLSLEKYGIYGASIYCLWSGKCEKNIRTLILLLKAVELGFLSKEDLLEMAADRWQSINLSKQTYNKLDRQVCNKVKNFKQK